MARIDDNYLRNLPCDYVVVDLETTGLSAKSDKIIEIGAVKVVNNLVVDKFQELINPNVSLPSVITRITGITDEMLFDAQPIDIVLPRFKEFLGDSILIAHNASFDCRFLNNNYIQLFGEGLCNGVVDTLALSRKVFKEFENHKLQTIIRNLGIEEETYHRALSDAVMTNKCYQKIKCICECK